MSATPSSSQLVTVTVNGLAVEKEVPARRLLVHFLRDDLDLTGTHIGCDTGGCGACTVHLDGVPVKLRGARRPGERGAGDDGGRTRGRRADAAAAGVLRPPRAPVRLLHAGDADERRRLLAENPSPTEEEVKVGLQGNICRCTGYWNIVEAVVAAGKGA